MREHAIGLGHVDPRAMAVGRDVGGEAALQLGIVVHGLVVDQQAIQGAAADRIVQDRGHLAVARQAPSAIWAAPSAARVSSRKQNFLRLLGALLGGVRRRSRRRLAGLSPIGRSAWRFVDVAASSPKAGEGIVEDGQVPGAGSPLVHCKTAEACLRPDASVSRVWARATESSDLGVA